MTKWHANVVHTAKHMDLVGSPSLVEGPGTPLNPALVQQASEQIP